ncbi:MAG: hypothetical protein HGA19_19695 [Oscillochloris sp.]|nr:hypothetical protein [Oscillochloris sp.]
MVLGRIYVHPHPARRAGVVTLARSFSRRAYPPGAYGIRRAGVVTLARSFSHRAYPPGAYGIR